MSVIEIDPRRMGGAPCFGGTRITVATVMHLRNNRGWDDADLLHAYPDLTQGDLDLATWLQENHTRVLRDLRAAATWAPMMPHPTAAPSDER